MHKAKAIVASAVVSVASFAAVAMPAHAAITSNTTAVNKCTVGDQTLTLGKSGNISVSNNVATVKFRVSGTNCKTAVTAASWIRVTADGISDQKFYTYSTGTFAPGIQTLKVAVPNCMYQVDLLEGSNPKAADGTANYQYYKDGKFVDSGLRDFVKGGSGTCEEKKPEVCPFDSRMAKDDPNCKKDTIVKVVYKNKTNTVVKTQPVSAAPVSSVPSTGADTGSMLASTMGLSTTTGLAYNLFRKRKLVK